MIIKKIKILLIVIFLISNYFGNLFAKQQAKILMKINNEIITNLDIERESRYLIALNNDLKTLKDEQILEIAKNSIIRETIKKIELKKNYDLDQEIKQIDLIIANFYKKLNLKDISEFKKYLKTYDINYEEVKKKIKIESLWNNLIYTQFSNQVEIDTEKLKKKIKSQNSEEEIYLLSEILFNIKNKNEFNKKYEDIKKSIIKTGFKNTANIFSISSSAQIGGKIGWINKSQLSELIKNELKKINIGEFSKPIKIVNGYLILKLEDKKIEKKEVDFNVRLKKLINFERNKQLNQFSILYYNKIKIKQKIQ